MSEQPTQPAQTVGGSDVASSPEAQAAVRATLAGQAQGVGGTDSAGIYGDVAGASQVTPAQSPEQIAADLAAKGAQPATGDTDAILAQLQAQIAALQKAADDRAASEQQAAADAAPKPPVLQEVIGALSGQPAGIVHAFQVIAGHLEELLGKL